MSEDLEARIKSQGDVVRQLKVEKAPKEKVVINSNIKLFKRFFSILELNSVLIASSWWSVGVSLASFRAF